MNFNFQILENELQILENKTQISDMSGPMGKPPLWKNCTFLDKCRLLCLTVDIIMNSKIIPHTLKIQHMSIITRNLDCPKSVVFADVKTLHANNIPIDKMPEGRFY